MNIYKIICWMRCCSSAGRLKFSVRFLQIKDYIVNSTYFTTKGCGTTHLTSPSSPISLMQVNPNWGRDAPVGKCLMGWVSAIIVPCMNPGGIFLACSIARFCSGWETALYRAIKSKSAIKVPLVSTLRSCGRFISFMSIFAQSAHPEPSECPPRTTP